MSHIHPGIRWICVVISRDQKLTTTDASSAFLSLAGGWEHVLGNYVFLGAPREREESRLLEFSLRLPVWLHFLFLVTCLYIKAEL